MTRGLHLSLTALLVVAFGVSSAFAFTPVLSQVPDVIISDQTPDDSHTPGDSLTPGDTLEGQAAGDDVFDFPDAFNIFELVSDEPSTVAGFTPDENLIYTFISSPAAPAAGGYTSVPADARISINGTRIPTTGATVTPSASGELSFKDEAVSSDSDANTPAVQGSLTYDFENGAGGPFAITRDIIDANVMTINVANPSGASDEDDFMVWTVDDGADAISGEQVVVSTSNIDLTEGATQWAYIQVMNAAGDSGFTDYPGDTGVTGTATADDDADGSGNDLQISVPNTAGMSYNYWVSGGGDLPYVDDGVYRLTWNVASTGFAAATDAPVVRCRTNYGIFGELGYFELVNEIGASKPAVGGNFEYRMIIEEQDAASATLIETSPNTNTAPENSLTLFFDVYDFNIGGNLGGGAVELESLTSELIARDALLTGALTEVDVTNFTQGVDVDVAGDLDFSGDQNQTRSFAAAGVTLTSDIAGTAGGGTTNLGVIPSDGAGELFGVDLLMDQISVGVIPVVPTLPSVERIYRATWSADTSANTTTTPLPNIVMSIQTNLMLNGASIGQLYTAQMGVLPTANDAATTNPGYDSGEWALYLQLPAGEALGYSTGWGNGISSSLYFRDEYATTGGSIVVDGATIQSIDAGLLP
jgi:hypothetical protein